MSEEDIAGLCQRVIRQLQNKYQWSLVDTTEFTRQVMTQAQHDQFTTENAVRKLALHLYSIVLFTACRGSDERRKQGLQDLSHYLYAVAYTKYNNTELATELTQAALVRVMAQLEMCKNPGTFLYFSLLRLRHAEDEYVREERRRRAQLLFSELTSDNDPATADDQPASELTDPTNIELGVHVHCVELIERVLELFGQIYHGKPRAQRQLVVVYVSFFVEQADAEIAQALQISTNQVQVLRSRGVAQLRSNPEFSHLLREWVANCKDSGITVHYQ